MNIVTTTSGNWSWSYASPPCGWCGAFHSGSCPRVRSLEYHKDGTIKRVEFFPPIEVGEDEEERE